jgi:type IV pilus assembly protein PilQ
MGTVFNLWNWILILLILNSTSVALLQAQDAVEEKTSGPVFAPPEEDVVLAFGEDASSTSVGATDNETISVDFPEEDVRTIIRNVADLYDLNVVIPEGLTGAISLKLRDVTWEQVFRVVLEPLNHTYLMDGNIVRIISEEELAVEPVDTRVFIVDFAKAEEIQGSIEPLVSEEAGGRLRVDTRSNALVITERPSRMGAIQEIIEILDQPTDQVMIESKFIEITGRENDSKGVNWQSLIGWKVQTGGLDGAPLGRVYERIDGSQSQPSVSDSTSFSVTNNSGVPSTSLSQSTTETGVTQWINSVTRTDTAVFSADAFGVILSALETSTNIELVSNPTIVTMNNKPAQINIGEEYPIPQYQYNQEQGTFEISNFEYKPIGVNLSVLPQINSAGFINLDIQPEISSRTGVVEFGGASGASIPIITVRKTDSSVTIKSGYTLAIGGLIQSDEENSETRVPILGALPGLGKLFSSEGVSTERRNLVVFITAKILNASGATYADVLSERKLFEMGVNRMDVPGYEASADEQELLKRLREAEESLEQIRREQILKNKVTESEEAEADAIKPSRRGKRLW